MRNRLAAVAEQETHALIEKSEQHFETAMPAIEIRFDLRGQAAGKVTFHRNSSPIIHYNIALLIENKESFLNQTLPHEVAHIVARTLFGTGIKPHGPEWQSVMNLFGAKASRCHDYDTSRSRVRRLQRYSYRCSCGQHQLTSIRHFRILRGQSYFCRKCKQPLVMD